jgi:hypothetical protein
MTVREPTERQRIRAEAFREAARLFNPSFWAWHDLQHMATAEDGIAIDGLPVVDRDVNPERKG